ncbi:MAG: DNA polymerase III subunit delta' [Thermorudis peleae]|nr:DNA polymerase III subunit delta' [Thermorudis peleae]
MTEEIRSNHNWNIIGHEAAVRQLQQALLRGQLAHAYLFSGPPHIGRRTLAVRFSQALCCQAPDDERPCGQCPACRRISHGTHPDFITISSPEGDTHGGNTRISIETIREIRTAITLRPLEAPYRIVLLDGADELSHDAADALLKTLEEPPSYAIFLLIVTSPEDLPETVRSRCQLIPLHPVPRMRVRAVLEAQGYPSSDAALIAQLSQGRVGLALQLAEDPAQLERYRTAGQIGLTMLTNRLNALLQARELAERYRRGQRETVAHQLSVLITLWDDLLALRAGLSERIAFVEFRETLDSLAQRWDIAAIAQGLAATCRALADLEANVQARLALDTMVLAWPNPPA